MSRDRRMQPEGVTALANRPQSLFPAYSRHATTATPPHQSAIALLHGEPARERVLGLCGRVRVRVGRRGAGGARSTPAQRSAILIFCHRNNARVDLLLFRGQQPEDDVHEHARKRR
jgi:hypothetical protein